MNGPLEMLTRGEHAARVVLRPDGTDTLRSALHRGYVHILFPETRGGTELGVTIDAEGSDLHSADFDANLGTLTIVGSLVLDYEAVRCTVRVELPSLTGTGYLERLSTSIGQ
jgi:hypothetical protein